MYTTEECRNLKNVIKEIKKDKKMLFLMAEQKNINNKIEKENVSDEKSDNEKMLPKIINEKITAICIYIDKVYYILVKAGYFRRIERSF